MAYYRARGSDSSSDSGFFDVVVQAGNLYHAQVIVDQHLDTLMRPELKTQYTLMVTATPNGVIFTSVEPME